MNTEYEVRILEIDKDSFIKMLEKLGAEKVGDFFQKRYVYDFNPVVKGKWIRLRTNGNESTLTIKNIVSPLIDGTKEIEIIVSDFDKCNYILNELGYKARSYQENKRIRYNLDGVEIDIDTWPLIPTYVEIEGKSEEEVMTVVKKLGYNEDEITTLDVDSIYKKYGYDLKMIDELKFQESGSMSLSELYSEKLNEYKKTRELQVAPSQVLSMLLLDKKDDFFPSNADIEHFYHDYSGEINKDVYKLGDDFSLKVPDDEDKIL